MYYLLNLFNLIPLRIPQIHRRPNLSLENTWDIYFSTKNRRLPSESLSSTLRCVPNEQSGSEGLRALGPRLKAITFPTRVQFNYLSERY